MGSIIRLITLSLLIHVPMELYPQNCQLRKNQLDSDGRKHGYWVEVSKLNPEQKTFKGWYDHGYETKRCTFYNNGAKWSKFRYVNDSLIRIKRYGLGGNLEYKGSALWLINNDEMRFCWNGEFVFYDKNRRKIKRTIYVKGVEQEPE